VLNISRLFKKMKAGRRLQGFSVMQPNDATEIAEARLANAVIAMDVSPPTATVREVQLAIQKQFEGRPCH